MRSNMIDKSDIQENIEVLERLYNSCSNQRKEFFYSKLAILELCGWLEESMDDIARRCCKRNMNDDKNMEDIENIIQKTYGFEYKKHFRNMLIQIIGFKGIEAVEREVNLLKFKRFKSTLGMLKTPRDIHAHTHLKGTIITIDSPSVTISKFQSLYEGLKEIENTLKNLKY